MLGTLTKKEKLYPIVMLIWSVYLFNEVDENQNEKQGLNTMAAILNKRWGL